MQLCYLGYKGICGIDFLLYDNEVFFLEFNPRFQGASFLIDLALSNYNLSLYQLNKQCFIDKVDNDFIPNLSNLVIPYSYKITGSKKLVYRYAITQINMESSSNGYYDFFSDIYHVMLPDWEESIKVQGKIFKKYLINIRI